MDESAGGKANSESRAKQLSWKNSRSEEAGRKERQTMKQGLMSVVRGDFSGRQQSCLLIFFCGCLLGCFKERGGGNERPRVYICSLDVLYAVPIPLSGSITPTDKYRRSESSPRQKKVVRSFRDCCCPCLQGKCQLRMHIKSYHCYLFGIKYCPEAKKRL